MNEKRHVSEIILPPSSKQAPEDPPASRRELEHVATEPMFSGNVRDAIESMIKVSKRVQEAYRLAAVDHPREGQGFGELKAAIHALTGVRLFLERCIGPKTHHLKTHPGPFRLVKNGIKKYEIRKFDRDFAVGDVLILQEFDPQTSEYSGEAIRARVVAITQPGEWGLPKDVGVLGIEIEL